MRVTRYLVILAPLGAVLADNTTYQCGRLDRVGPPSEGGKYVCGLETLRAGCVVYSFGISGDSRFESYLLAREDFSRVAAAVEALEAEGWRVVRKGILPGQCTSDARHKGSPGPVRARIVFARRAPA